MEVEQMALMIPILGIVLGVAVAVVAIVASHREKVSRAELRHRERIAALEKGIELPPEPLEPETDRKIGTLKSGVMGVLLGILLYFAIREVADASVALFGLIPTAIGVANLVSYFVEAKKKDANGNGNGK